MCSDCPNGGLVILRRGPFAGIHLRLSTLINKTSLLVVVDKDIESGQKKVL
jgi:hypothetical protein